MKRVLIVLPTLPNYRKDFFNALSARLAEKDIELMIFHGATKKKVIKDVEDKKFNSRYFETTERTLGSFTITSLKGLKKAVKEYSPDCLITLFNPATISLVSVLLYCIRRSIPYAIWSCGYVRPNLSRLLVRIREKFLFFFDRHAKIQIAYHTLRKEYLVRNGIPAESIFVAQNTIDTETIMDSYNLDDVNANRYNGKLRILFVGALIKGKCLKEAMNAVDSLISKNCPITFTIIGGGEIINELKAHREALIHKEDIMILGAKYGDELKSYFLNSDVFLLAGSGGLAINEAMAYGLPIISTNGDGTGRDLIENNGYMLCKKGDEEEIRSAICRFVRLSRKEQVKMSENSCLIIKRKATLTLMTDNFQKAVMALIHNNTKNSL